MKIGISLPVAYLAGAGDDAGTRVFSDGFGEPRAALAAFREQGVESVEMLGFGSAAVLMAAVLCVLSSGMRVSIHGFLPDDMTKVRFADACPQLYPVFECLAERQGSTIMVVHALPPSDIEPGNLAHETARALDKLAAGIAAEGWPVRIALEINRYHGVETPGVLYDGLLDIAGRMNEASAGFCWDMGHTHSSFLQNKLAAAPPNAFIERVIHAHIHGVSCEGDTHLPLAEPAPHIESGIKLLQSAGYDGIYNLELYPRRWSGKHELSDAIMLSIACLRRMLYLSCFQPETRQS